MFSPIILGLFFCLAFFASTEAASSANIYDAEWGKDGHSLHCFISIANFSQMTNEELVTGRAHIDVPVGSKTQDVGMKFVFKYRSLVFNDMLQVMIVAEAAISQKVPELTLKDGQITVDNILGKKNLELPFKQVNLTNDSPRSLPFNLLSKNVLINPRNGWYNKEKDQAKFQVKFNF